MTHILKSPYDKKSYREITLRNGLTALLISDMDQPSLRPIPVLRDNRARTSSSSDTSETDTTGTDSDDRMSVSQVLELEGDTEVPVDSSGLLMWPAKKKKVKAEVKKKQHKCRKCGHPVDHAFESSVDYGTGYENGKSMEVVMAAAALCVGVGSFYDPDDIQGFTHFLEHMVFMGSKKYKKENAFDDFIAKHGGDTNAWTDTERSTFFFDIQKEHFFKALDMFAYFFISPLFIKSSVDREIMAVDNEFQMILPSDNDRYHQLLGSLAFLGNPLSRFLCGNKKTLKTIPEEKHIDVHGRLRDFYRRMYSAHYMTLVVQAPEPLDDLQQMVYDLFEDIPNNKMMRPSLAEYRDPFVPRNFHKLLKVVPMEDCQRLDMCWALPPLWKRFRAKPLDYVGTLVTHEGPGSILSFLRKKAWALSLSGGNMGSGFDQNCLWSGFSISILLTDEGMAHAQDVIRTVFEYMDMMQKCGPQAWFYTELRDIENIKFRFREEMDPIDNVEQVVENMQLYPLEHYLTGRCLILSYDEQLIRECLSLMAPSQCCLMLWTKAYEKQGICDKVEPWFNTPYCISDVPEEWKQEWRNLKVNHELYLPEKNPFIPTNFDLITVEEATEYPVQVVDSQHGRMWYKKDNKFKVPKGFILLHLMTPVVSNSVTSATLCDLFINILQQQLLENLYAASLAGYEFSLEGLSTGIVIQMEGFSQKLPQLMEMIVNHMAEFEVTKEIFDVVRSQLKKCYYNEMIRTFEFAKMLRFAVTERTNPPLPDRYEAADSLTLDMLMKFHKELMDNLYVEGLVTGNFISRQAVCIAEFVQQKLCHRLLPADLMPEKRLLKLPKGDLLCRVQGVNSKDANSCVTCYYQHGPATIRKTCLNDLLVTRMKEPVFNKLRTELQLGYSVFCQALVSNGILGFAVTVETHANKFKMSDIQAHIESFMKDFQKIINKMTKPNFKELVNSVITSKQVEDTQLGDETSRFWQEILDRYYIFDRQDKEIDMLDTITLSELKSWYQLLLNPSRRYVSFQVEGCSVSPMEAEETQTTIMEVHAQEIGLSRSINEKHKHFLEPIVDGPGCIDNIAKFRDSLSLFPPSKVVT